MHSSKRLTILVNVRSATHQSVPGDYSIYHDHTNYKYDITLARADLLTNTNERHVLKVCAPFLNLRQQHDIFTSPVFPYTPLPFRPRVRLHRPWAQRLQLYESNATPKLYACFEKHSKPGESPTANMLAPVGSSFDTAFDHFKKFFNLKTGKAWDDRFQRMESAKGAFVFALPKPGEARGVIQNDKLVTEGNGEDHVHLTADEPSGSRPSQNISLKVENEDAMIDLTGDDSQEAESGDELFLKA